MITGSVARRYAKALLEIGVAGNNFDANGKELERIAAAFQTSPDLLRTLSNPVFPFAKRRLIIEELARRLALSKTLRNFVLLLLDKGRIASIIDIAREHKNLVDAQAGRVRAVLTSAKPVDAALETRIKTALEKSTGKVVLLEKKEDPALIGGMTTQVGDTVFDGSVRTRLQTLREELLR